MAKIVLGMGSSHAPQLEMPPARWRDYGDLQRKQAEHWYQGRIVSFQELADLRVGEHFERECTDEKCQTRFDACQTAIAHLGRTLDAVAPDVCILVGDDQHESFHDDNMPALSIFYGNSVVDDPTPSGRRGDFVDLRVGNYPTQRLTHPGEPALGEYLVEAMIDHEFDVARSSTLPAGRHNGTIGHAFYYVYRRLMNNEALPHVPIMVNTYFPPNAPKAGRCYRFGQALREAIEAWDSDKRVAIIASGGLSHTVIEEDLDARSIDGLKTDDVQKLTDLPDVRFRGGTSEIKNWIIVAGAMAGDGLQMNLVDYVPCYRNEAGNGAAMGFAEWV
jgi:hypothetical protein